MKVKKYVVDSMPDAMKKIREDLGNQAVILNTKRVKTGGFLGLFGKNQIEVIAAIDPSIRKANPPLNKMEGAASPSGTEPKRQRTEVRPPSEHSDAYRLQTRKAAATPASASENSDAIAQEIRDMKQFMVKIMSQREESPFPKELEKWTSRLRDQGCEDAVIHRMVEELIRAHDDLTQIDEADIEQSLLHIVESWIRGRTAVEETHDSGMKIINLFGPTGVGKTTTIAKLAAEKVLKQKNKVGMLTTDTYRIAAVEQLKTYANILNVPVEVIFSPDDIDKALQKLKDCDLIFMDTAGRNFLEKQFIEDIKDFLSVPVQCENVLVLSLTSKFSDIKNIVNNFAAIPIDRLILTKMDETSSYGMLLNLLHDFDYPLSHITTGQSVPEDIMKVNPNGIAKLILGVDEDEGRSSAAIARIPAKTK